jgi:hypothetical protein
MLRADHQRIESNNCQLNKSNTQDYIILNTEFMFASLVKDDIYLSNNLRMLTHSHKHSP